MSDKQIVIVDFSSIAHPLFHTTGTDPNPDALSLAIVAKVRALASGQPHVALALDSRKSFRKELSATYKAGRESKPEAFFFQCRAALETLRADGFPTWEADGFEADDVIASAEFLTRNGDETPSVLVVSADKDLLALVNERVSVKSPISGNVMTPEGVVEKFGVSPNQIMDYLTLVGDASDGVTGVKGIGAKGAASLLQTFGNLDDLYAALDNGGAAVKPAQLLALNEFRPSLGLTRQLLALRTDAPIDFAAVLAERVPLDVASFGEDPIMDDIEEAMPTWTHKEDAVNVNMLPSEAMKTNVAEIEQPQGVTSTQLIPVVALPAPKPPVSVDYEHQLEPQSMHQAVQLAGLMFKARLFNAYGTPEAVLSTILSGRELGLAAMASLRSFHVVEGKPTLAADALRALVLKSGKAKSFRCIERTPLAAAFITERHGEDPATLRYTIEEAHTAGLVKNGSGWTKNPADMLVARASSKLARLVYPDVVAGLYAPEEF